MDVTQSLHGLWCDVDANSGAHDVLLYLPGLWAAQLQRVLPATPAGALPHLGPGSNGGLVDCLAAGVHEVASAGPLWRKRVPPPANEVRLQAERWRHGHVPWPCSWLYPELCRQWDQHDCDELRAAEGHRTGPSGLTLLQTAAPDCISSHRVLHCECSQHFALLSVKSFFWIGLLMIAVHFFFFVDFPVELKAVDAFNCLVTASAQSIDQFFNGALVIFLVYSPVDSAESGFVFNVFFVAVHFLAAVYHAFYAYMFKGTPQCLARLKCHSFTDGQCFAKLDSHFMVILYVSKCFHSMSSVSILCVLSIENSGAFRLPLWLRGWLMLT